MRLATTEDLPQIMVWAAKYHDEYKPNGPWDAEAVEAFIRTLIEAPQGLVLVGKGFIAGMKAPNPLCPSWVIARELLWWGEGDGFALWSRFRQWAKQDAAEIHYSCAASAEKVRRFYARVAEPYEVTYSEIT